jgi:hypothetical protein
MARTWVDIGSIYGGAWIGKAITRLAVELDARFKDLTSASLWTTIAATVGVPVFELLFRKGRLDVLDLALLTMGGHISTNLLDYIEKKLGVKPKYIEYAPRVTVTAAPPVTEAPQVTEALPAPEVY